jgi:hypothetical protein
MGWRSSYWNAPDTGGSQPGNNTLASPTKVKLADEILPSSGVIEITRFASKSALRLVLVYQFDGAELRL